MAAGMEEDLHRFDKRDQPRKRFTIGPWRNRRTTPEQNDGGNLKDKQNREIKALKECNEKLTKGMLEKEMELDRLRDQNKQEVQDIMEKLNLKDQENLVYKEDFERERQDRERIHTKLKSTEDELMESQKECKILKQKLSESSSSNAIELKQMLDYELGVKNEQATELARMKQQLVEQQQTISHLQQQIAQFNESIEQDMASNRHYSSSYDSSYHTHWPPYQERDDNYTSIINEAPIMTEDDMKKLFQPVKDGLYENEIRTKTFQKEKQKVTRFYSHGHD